MIALAFVSSSIPTCCSILIYYTLQGTTSLHSRSRLFSQVHFMGSIFPHVHIGLLYLLLEVVCDHCLPSWVVFKALGKKVAARLMMHIRFKCRLGKTNSSGNGLAFRVNSPLKIPLSAVLLRREQIQEMQPYNSSTCTCAISELNNFGHANKN